MKLATDPRHNARRAAICALFTLHTPIDTEILSTTFQETVEELLQLEPSMLDRELYATLTSGVGTYLKDIDTVIEQCAPDWPLEKISKIDLAILRTAIYELLYSNQTPDKVIIDEAVELAKEFGSDSSKKFVNGVLGTVVDIKEKTVKNTQGLSQTEDSATNSVE